MKSNRHKHRLRLVTGEGLYECNGCKEYGTDEAYRCVKSSSGSCCNSCCNIIFHKDCAELPDSLPLFSNSSQTFCFRQSPAHRRDRCYACGDVLGGFCYKGKEKKKSVMLHPLCMTLPQRFHYTRHEAHDVELERCPPELRKDRQKCARCDDICVGWLYVCTEVSCSMKGLCVQCAKLDILGLSKHNVSHISSYSSTRSRKKHLGKADVNVATGIISAAAGVFSAAATSN